MARLLKRYREEIMYLIFGCIVTAVNWVTYSLLVSFTEIGVTVSNAVAWILSVAVAFVTNKLFVFKNASVGKKAVLKELLIFVLSRITTGLFEVFAPSVLIYLGLNQTIFGIDGAIAKLIVGCIVVILNYLVSKLFVFKS